MDKKKTFDFKNFDCKEQQEWEKMTSTINSLTSSSNIDDE